MQRPRVWTGVPVLMQSCLAHRGALPKLSCKATVPTKAGDPIALVQSWFSSCKPLPGTYLSRAGEGYSINPRVGGQDPSQCFGPCDHIEDARGKPSLGTELSQQQGRELGSGRS